MWIFWDFSTHHPPKIAITVISSEARTAQPSLKTNLIITYTIHFYYFADFYVAKRHPIGF